MSAHLINPYHVATTLAYALNKPMFDSLAGSYIKYLQSKIKAQYQPNGTLIINDEQYSESDKEFLITLELSDFYDTDFDKKSNIKKLAELIYQANFASLDERYSENSQEYLGELDRDPMKQLTKDDFKSAIKKASELDVFQFVCMVDYIKYQCTSLTNFENSICCKFLDSLVYNAIRTQPSYKTMDWGLTKAD